MTNPLLAEWDTPFGLPPYERIRDEDFPPAFEAALEEARAEIEAIAENPAPPDFANTVEALELAGATLERVAAVFFGLAGADSNPAREAIQRDIAPRLAAHAAALSTDPRLHARIEALWQRREALGLDAEGERVLFLWRRMFRRSGAGLGAAERHRLAEIAEALASLQTRFAQNVLADERDSFIELSEEDVAPLPEGLVSTLAGIARKAERGRFAATRSRALVVPILELSPDRALRERVWRFWMERGLEHEDNVAIAAEILKLRQERARLLGHADHAAYRTETEMAGTPEAVRRLLDAVWAPALRRANRDAAAIEALMREDGINGAVQPWDWRHYAARRRQREHDLDEAALKPHFALEAMRDAAFDTAGRLFGLEFRRIDVPLYHPDVEAWEVTRGGRHMAVFIADYLARPSKRSGAWCSALRRQRRLGAEERAVVVNVCNFAKPEGDRPVLLSWDEARTLFHEFGHALHHILSDVRHPSVSGTSVARDFVELPSQLFEHWLETPEVLGRHARHVETGAPMPAELRDRLLGARTLDSGFETVEYLASARIDLELHTGPAPRDPAARAAAVMASAGLPAAIVPRHDVPHFLHAFAGEGYAAGYYSYLWSEVMDADAFAAFEEAGDVFDKEVARRLEETILSKGGAADPAELYRAFRGRAPGIGPLLAGRGLDGD